LPWQARSFTKAGRAQERVQDALGADPEQRISPGSGAGKAIRFAGGAGDAFRREGAILPLDLKGLRGVVPEIASLSLQRASG
jgi:hypothetical protein